MGRTVSDNNLEYDQCISDVQPNPDEEWCAAVRDECLVEANGGTPDGVCISCHSTSTQSLPL